MSIKMLATFKSFKAGQVVDPDEATTAWLISRRYAEPVTEAPVFIANVQDAGAAKTVKKK